MTQHTEGEWINCDLHEKFTNVKRVIKTKEGIILAYVVYEDERVPGISERGEDIININMANARLMCAAPKLLKALKLAVELGRLPLDEKKIKIAFEKARAAIAEAEGGL